MRETCEKIDEKIDGVFDWLNADGQEVVKITVVGVTLIGLIAFGAWFMGA